jgi:hypothetical protein
MYRHAIRRYENDFTLLIILQNQLYFDKNKTFWDLPEKEQVLVLVCLRTISRRNDVKNQKQVREKGLPSVEQMRPEIKYVKNTKAKYLDEPFEVWMAEDWRRAVDLALEAQRKGATIRKSPPTSPKPPNEYDEQVITKLNLIHGATELITQLTEELALLRSENRMILDLLLRRDNRENKREAPMSVDWVIDSSNKKQKV